MTETPLTSAIDRGAKEEIENLLRAGADPNESNAFGESPLMIAAMANSVHALELLLLHGADVNRQYHDGFTVLHLAVDFSIDSTIQSGGSPGDEPTEAIQWLLMHGADINLKSSEGETALDIAITYRSDRIANLLR